MPFLLFAFSILAWVLASLICFSFSSTTITSWKCLEMYLYLASAIKASKSFPKTSSLKVCLNSSTIWTRLGWASVSSSSSSTNLTAWNKGFSTLAPSKAIRQSFIRWYKLVSSKTVLPLRPLLLASYAFCINKSKLSSFNAEISTTGIPSSFSSLLIRTDSLFLERRSIIFNAKTIGTSISKSWVVK